MVSKGLAKDFFVYTRASLKLLEQVARCIECNEPVLLCGETGVGKTSSLQHLARLLGKKIHVINLSQQTETGDLLGSYKPVDVKVQMKMLKEKFMALFERSFSQEENQTFLGHVQVNRELVMGFLWLSKLILMMEVQRGNTILRN